MWAIQTDRRVARHQLWLGFSNDHHHHHSWSSVWGYWWSDHEHIPVLSLQGQELHFLGSKGRVSILGPIHETTFRISIYMWGPKFFPLAFVLMVCLLEMHNAYFFLQNDYSPILNGTTRVVHVLSHCPYTGSFRKSGKSKTVFMGTKFHEKLIFSAFFSRELATNLRSWATRSVTITLWHPEKVAPPVWFQALVGWLSLTTASTP